MNTKTSELDKKGCFADYLIQDEVVFSKIAAKELEKILWAKKLLEEPKVTRAIQTEPDNNRKYSDLNEIKSALFEIRFAYSVYKSGLIAEYECNCGLGDTSIDFKIEDSNYTWLIELTSCRESSEVKKNTTISDNYFNYCSISNPLKNSPEVVDIIKTQHAILNKVCNKAKPIKFPVIQNSNNKGLHMILVDMRSFNAGMSDYCDYANIACGSKFLINVDNGAYCRNWIDQNGKVNLIKGLFDPDYPDIRSKRIHESIHILGFVHESDYDEKELITKTRLFYNPRFFDKEQKLPILYK